MNLAERITLLTDLGTWIESKPNELKAAVQKSHYDNKWFVPDNCWYALEGISKQFLQKDKLEKFTGNYNFSNITPKVIGLIFAGNIPLVGFHDFLTVFLSGHRAQIKLSDKDTALFKAIWDFLNTQYANFADIIQLTQKLTTFDAVIATGSDNSARQFAYYFKSYPKIIRKNRNAVAILSGQETDTDLENLCKDIAMYFGLGCRNVSKLFIPKDYDFGPLFKALDKWSWMMDHYKYSNNYQFNYATFALNRNAFLSNGSTILIEENQIPSRISTVHFEYYDNIEKVEKQVIKYKENIQCVVGPIELTSIDSILPGNTQKPLLEDYADNVDTMEFLLQL